jgi:hypothetical protein
MSTGGISVNQDPSTTLTLTSGGLIKTGPNSSTIGPTGGVGTGTLTSSASGLTDSQTGSAAR